MNKQELISKLAERAQVNKVIAERVVDALTAELTETLKAGGEFRLAELGRFSVKTRAPRNSMNPRTQERILVPAKTIAKFKPGKQLAEALR